MSGAAERGGTEPVRQPRALVFSHDGRGLGHLRRLARIGAALQGPCAVLFIAGHRACSWLVPEECGYVRLPSLEAMDPRRSAAWGREPFWGTTRAQALRLRRRLMEAVLAEFNPDAVFVDHHPLGMANELAPLLAGSPARCYFVMRGVMMARTAAAASLLSPHCRRALEERYSRIFVAADRRVTDVASDLPLGSRIEQKLDYSGYVAPPAPERGAARAARGVPEGTPWVVCAAGGGMDGEELAQTGLELSQIFPEAYFDIIAGPRSRLRLQQGTLAGRVRIAAEDPSLAASQGACDVLISRGGYNSLLEGIVGGARILVLPTPGDYEQREHPTRLGRFYPVGLVSDAETLADHLETTLLAVGEGPRPRCDLDMSGATRIAEQVLLDFGIRAAANSAALAVAG